MGILKRLAVVAAFLFLPAMTFAKDISITKGQGSSISLDLTYLRETMISLPSPPQAVTGAGKPNFQVEPGGDYIMVRPLEPGAKGNLFVNLGDRTIVSLVLNTQAGGGEELVTIKYGGARLEGEKAVERWKPVTLTDDLRILARPWEIKRIKRSTKNAGFILISDYALIADDTTIVNFEIKNDSPESFAISKLEVSLATLGGVKGTEVLDSQPLQARSFIGTNTLSAGEGTSGVIVFQGVEPDHDQTVILRIINSYGQGPELRISL